MIEKQGKTITLLCDDCDDVLDKEFDKDDFHGMIGYAKSEGWAVKKDDAFESGWTHRCPLCKQSRLEEQRKLFGG